MLLVRMESNSTVSGKAEWKGVHTVYLISDNFSSVFVFVASVDQNLLFRYFLQVKNQII